MVAVPYLLSQLKAISYSGNGTTGHGIKAHHSIIMRLKDRVVVLWKRMHLAEFTVLVGEKNYSTALVFCSVIDTFTQFVNWFRYL